METKDIVAQEVLSYDALYRRSVLLDQFKQGLEEVGILRLITQFPNEMSSLFTFTGDLTNEEVIDAVYVVDDVVLSDDDSAVMSLFVRFIQTLNSSG